MSQLTKKRQLNEMRRQLAQVEMGIIELAKERERLITERQRLMEEFSWRSQMITDELAAGWLAAENAETIRAIEIFLGCE